MLKGGTTVGVFTRGYKWGSEPDSSPLAWRGVDWLVAHSYKFHVCECDCKTNLLAHTADHSLLNSVISMRFALV